MKRFSWARNVRDFRLYITLGTVLALLSIFMSGCTAGTVLNETSPKSEDTTTGNQNPSPLWFQEPSLLSLPRWVWLALAGVLLVAGSASVTGVAMRRRYSSGAGADAAYISGLLAGEAIGRNELEVTRQKLQKYESLQFQVPSLEAQYKRLVAESRQYPQTSEPAFTHLLSAPATEYAALNEQVKAVQAICSYFDAEKQKGRPLRSECLELARQIREDEPLLFDTLEIAINQAPPAGLIALKRVLEQMAQQARKAEVSPQVKSDLAQLEKSLEGIVDYSIRLMPVRLLGFARDLIASPASGRENALREKTVQKIIGLVKEYLRL